MSFKLFLNHMEDQVFYGRYFCFYGGYEGEAHRVAAGHGECGGGGKLHHVVRGDTECVDTSSEVCTFGIVVGCPAEGEVLVAAIFSPDG